MAFPPLLKIALESPTQAQYALVPKMRITTAAAPHLIAMS